MASRVGSASTVKSILKNSTNNKAQLLDDSDSDSNDGGASIEDPGFTVNEDYARRFEHNKKREERHRREWNNIQNTEQC